MKDELGGQIMKDFAGLRVNTYSYLKINMMKIKKQKTKESVTKIKFKFQDYKNYLEAAQLGNKINDLKKIKANVDSLNEFIKSNKLILKTQKRFKSERHNVLVKKLIRSNNDKRMKSIDSIETYAHGTSRYLVCKKEEIKCTNIIKKYKNVIKEHNPNWPDIPDHAYRILIVGGSESGKTNALLNLINNEPDIDKICLYAKGLYESEYQLLISKKKLQANDI